MKETGTTSIGLSIELVRGFIFFGAEEFDEVDAFLFFTVGRIGVGVGAGGAEDFGSFSLGATDAVALTSSLSSGAPLVDALAISSAGGMESSALAL